MKHTLLLLASFCVGIPFGHSQQVELISFASGLNSPTSIENAGDTRLFITEQNGIIKIVDYLGIVHSTPFLDISGSVNSSSNEQGLLGLAFHPNYSSNGYFFLNYTASDGSTNISRFAVDPLNPNLANPLSEFVILNVAQPFVNHNGGSINFGSDGFLYIGLGDGGGAGDPNNNGQNTDVLLGSILRIDVDSGSPYSIPPSNPFVGTTGADEIWAYGLRNPWRFSFDPLNGTMWIGDVGQNSFEEINIGILGGNFGWNCYEGTAVFSGSCPSLLYIFPIYEFDHAGGGCSVTGGEVYRGSLHSNLYGHYLFSDYCDGEIRTIYDNGGTWTALNHGNLISNPSTFGKDIAGEIYIASHSAGVIYKITDMTTSVGANAQNSVIGIYPSPASETVTINFDYDLGKTYGLKIFDVSGKTLKSIDNINTNEINVDLHDVAKGIYMFRLFSSDAAVGFGKLMVE